MDDLIPMEDVGRDDFEDTIGDTTGAVGGTPAETDFGGGQIQTRRGSVGWENPDASFVSDKSRNSIKDLNARLDVLKLRENSPSLRRTVRELNLQKAGLARDEFRDYVERLGYTQRGTTFVTGAVFAIDESGRIKVSYRKKQVWLTKQNSSEFYP